MIYNVGKDFVRVEEFSGTIYNNSSEFTLEISEQPVKGSGSLLFPDQSQSFRYKEFYMRCIDGTAEVNCVPFDLDPSKHVDGDKFVEGGEYLHLTFDFPTGSNKTMLLRNPRPDLTISDLQNFSEYIIEQDVFRNDFAEPTLGLKKIMMIKSMVRGAGGSSTPQTGGNTGDEQTWSSGQIDDDNPKPIIVPVTVPTIYYDVRRKLTRDVEELFDLRRTISKDRTTFTADLRRRVKWRWLTRILPDSSFLDPKMYASAEALDDQITLFHWAIKNVLHLPRLGELKGTVLDLLADQFHVDAYDAINFTDEEKRDLIRNSIAWHRIKGTPAAVEMVLAVAFSKFRVDEWFDYDGKPYYFRLYIKGTAYSPGSFQSFWRMFLDAKNVRSHLEKVTIDISPDESIKVYTGVATVTTGVRKSPLYHLPDRVAAVRKIFTGMFRVNAGVVLKRMFIPRPNPVCKKISTGVVSMHIGRRTVGMNRVPEIPRSIHAVKKISAGIVSMFVGARTIDMNKTT